MGTFVKPTTHFKRRLSGSNIDLGFLSRRAGGGWSGLSSLKRSSGGAWVWIYSTPDVTAGGGGAATGAGSSSSGTTTRGVTATPGGTDSGSRSYSWTYVTGDTGITFNAGSAFTDQNPTMKRDFSGVANGTTSSGVSAVWRCMMTDTATGAQVYSDVTVGPLAWQNTIPAFTPFNTNNITGGTSGSEPVPTNASSLTIKVAGSGGKGGNGWSGTDPGGGGGGGSGGFTSQIVAITSADWGRSISWSVGTGGAPAGSAGSSTASGSLTNASISLTATGGSVGQSGVGGGGAGGAGGTPGGGTGIFGGGGAAGGGGGGGNNGSGYGSGGAGGNAGGSQPGANGAAGAVIFMWT